MCVVCSISLLHGRSGEESAGHTNVGMLEGRHVDGQLEEPVRPPRCCAFMLAVADADRWMVAELSHAKKMKPHVSFLQRPRPDEKKRKIKKRGLQKSAYIRS